jgi:maltose alpha-D-glucosyltransferase/alpha-amylase
LERSRAGLDESIRSEADSLLARRMALIERTGRVPVPHEPLVKTRYHGDLHFGQVLVTGNDFVIIDFEGEPMRSIEARRGKHSPLRDVAGMLRSASYCAHATVNRLAQNHRERHSDILRAALQWEVAAAGAFIAGYRATVVGLASVPQDTGIFDEMLDLFLIEKALYEMRYELEHRPQWASIPLQGLIGLLGRPAESTQ